MRTVLIVGQKPDAHIDSVTKILRNKGAKIFFFDPLYPERSLLNIHLSARSSEASINVGINHHLLSEIGSVWWRVKPIRPSGRGRRFLWTDFALREWRSFLESLDAYMPNSKWVNTRISEMRARNKPFQLHIARNIGFKVPETIISNNPDQIRDFVSDKDRKFVYKVLTWYIEDTNFIFTSEVDTNHLDTMRDSIKICPCIFQEKIEKAFELRITTVNEKLFATKIDSQISKDARTDWRRNQFRVPYSKYKLPDEICSQIMEMNKKLGLNYAAYDFIVTKENDYCFLEVNPSGAWLWIENKIGFPISKTLAEFLLS